MGPTGKMWAARVSGVNLSPVIHAILKLCKIILTPFLAFYFAYKCGMTPSEECEDPDPFINGILAILIFALQCVFFWGILSITPITDKALEQRLTSQCYMKVLPQILNTSTLPYVTYRKDFRISRLCGETVITSHRVLIDNFKGGL